MAKASATAGYITFTRSDCENWVELPIDIIASAEHVGTRPCKDHSHPVLQIALKEPKDSTAKVLASLLSQSDRGTGYGQPTTNGGRPQMGGGGMPILGGWEGTPMVSPNSRPSAAGMARMRSPGGFRGDVGYGGNFDAWGCWDSTCTRCLVWEYVCNGAGACWNICRSWEEYPCERCIWPY
jgi:hypothetical protein